MTKVINKEIWRHLYQNFRSYGRHDTDVLRITSLYWIKTLEPKHFLLFIFAFYQVLIGTYQIICLQHISMYKRNGGP